MISCVSPTYTSANHTLNTLRYSDRLKEQTKQHFGGNYNNINNARGFNQGGNNGNINSNNNINIIQSPKNMNKNDNNNKNINNNKGNNKILRTDRSKSKGKKTVNKKEELKNKQNKNNNSKSDKLEKNEQKKKDIPNKNELNEDNIINIDNGEEEDWDYLKRTMAKRDGKIMNDDFIKYNHLTAKLVEDEDDIINYHMNIIKEDAKLLTQEGDLITNIKGVGKEGDFKMDEYIAGLDKIIEKKLKIYNNIKGKVDIYKMHIKEEDELRQKLDPKFFMDNN